MSIRSGDLAFVAANWAVGGVASDRGGKPSVVTETTTPGADIFDNIATLQADAAIHLGFDIADRIAATGPGPAVLRVLADAMPRHAPATIVDLGAGLGGASTWLTACTGSSVIAVEPCDRARQAARTLFPGLDVRAGTAEHSGLDDNVADAVVLVGVSSLLTELGPVLCEVRRLLRGDGVLAIADMFLNPETGPERVERTGINTLRSVTTTSAALRAAGFRIVSEHVAIDAKPDGWWVERSNELHDHVVRRHGDDPAIATWLADQEQLAEWFRIDHVHNGCVIARPAVVF